MKNKSTSQALGSIFGSVITMILGVSFAVISASIFWGNERALIATAGTLGIVYGLTIIGRSILGIIENYEKLDS